MVMIKAHRQATHLRQSKRKRRVFTDDYKANVLKTVAHLIETAPNKINLFLKREGLTWSGIQQWKDQVNGEAVTRSVPQIESGGTSEENSQENKIGRVTTNGGGVRNMQVGRAGKYKNVTLDRLYTENLRLKERLAELEGGSRKEVKLIIELQNKMFNGVEVDTDSP